MKRVVAAACVALALGATLGGCYRIVLRDGSPTGRAPVLHEHAWHHGFVLGIGEIPATGYRLDELCPGGWSEVEVYTSALNSVASAIVGAFAFYSPQTISIRCAATGDRYDVELDAKGTVEAVRARE